MGGPGIRSHVTNVTRTMGGQRVKIKRGQHTGDHTILPIHLQVNTGHRSYDGVIGLKGTKGAGVSIIGEICV